MLMKRNGFGKFLYFMIYKKKKKKNPFFSLEVFEDITLPFSDVSKCFMILV